MTTLLVIARAMHFGSGMILVGFVAFRWLVLRPSQRDDGREDEERENAFFRQMNLIFIFAAGTLLLSGLALFWVTTANMSGTTLPEALDRDTMSTVLWQTMFGRVVQVRAACLVVLALSLRLALSRPLASSGSRWLAEVVCALAAVALLVSNSFAGHAAATGRPALPWRIGSDAAHLLCASVWPTGLLFFSLYLAQAAKCPETCRTVRRFSDVSLLAVALLMATGLLNTYFLVRSFPALFITSYGHVLLFKLSLLGLILLVAAWNRFRLLPALFLAEQEAVFSDLLQRLRSFVLVELSLAAAIVVVVGLLGITPPPH